MAYHVKSKKSGDTYYLHRREVTLRGGRRQVIHFFAREIREGALDELPADFVVTENPRTGLPMLKRQSAGSRGGQGGGGKRAAHSR